MEYHLGTIGYTEYEDGSFRYVIAPNYSVIALLHPPLFQGIPGVNLDLHRKEYVRENRTPVFVSERAPAENREDVRELLDMHGLEYLNRLEWLIRTPTRYSGDNLYVIRAEEADLNAPVFVGDLSGLGARSSQATKALLDMICRGRVIQGEGFSIDDSNRAEYFAILHALYAKEKSFIDKQRQAGIERASAEGKYQGRQRRRLDEIVFADVMERYDAATINAEQAARELGVSRATFFRRSKEFHESGPR
ncbi:MAG: recombinase family protein [Gordonibacter sp.]|uniref:recombinase family protein n=1 Tax=Gordonibacter sp. TaxID=1968902 RepID=UPI002FC92396